MFWFVFGLKFKFGNNTNSDSANFSNFLSNKGFFFFGFNAAIFLVFAKGIGSSNNNFVLSATCVFCFKSFKGLGSNVSALDLFTFIKSSIFFDGVGLGTFLAIFFANIFFS